MRDRASVNDVAIRTLNIVYPKLFDVGCFSHTLDHVGEKLHTPVLDEFAKPWINMFSRSHKSKLAWRTQTGLSVPSHSNTRWWSKWEVLRQVHDCFGDVFSFITNSADMSPAYKSKLIVIISNPVKLGQLQMELAITIDVGEPFVKATYNLEGDGPLALTAYEHIRHLYFVASTVHYPNTAAVANKLSNGNPVLYQQLYDYALSCARPAYDYFRYKFDNDLKKAVSGFKAARFFDPVKVCELQPIGADIDDLKVFPFFTDTMIEGLKTELPTYLAKADDVSLDVVKTRWWQTHESELLKWSSACKQVLLIQPSSASAERVFSLLANSFNDRQNSALEDYIETSIMLQYNSKPIPYYVMSFS